jgi:hypothetical protein
MSCCNAAKPITIVFSVCLDRNATACFLGDPGGKEPETLAICWSSSILSSPAASPTAPRSWCAAALGGSVVSLDDDTVRRLLNGIAAARLGLPRTLAPGGARL